MRTINLGWRRQPHGMDEVVGRERRPLLHERLKRGQPPRRVSSEGDSDK